MSFLDSIKMPAATAAKTDAVPANPFLGLTAGKPNPLFANLMKKMNEKEQEEKKPAPEAVENKPEEAKAEEAKVETAPAKAEEPVTAEVETVDTKTAVKAEDEKTEAVADESAKAAAEPPEAPKVEVEATAPVQQEEEKAPVEENKAEETEKQTEEAPVEEKPKKTRRRRKAAEKKEDAKAEAADTDSADDKTAEEAPATGTVEVEPQNMNDVEEFRSKYSYREASDLLMGALDAGEEDWTAFRDDITARLQKVRIDQDLNPGTAKYAMDELDAMFTEVKLNLIKTDSTINRISNKETGIATIIKNRVMATLKGKVTTVERDYAVQKALSDIENDGNHINVLCLLSKAQDRKIILDGFMSIIDSKKKALITANGLMKIETTAAGGAY